ncbi:MAG: tRNA pseudouridine(13) synthase TruD [Planctomycetota bacterium]
MVLSYLTRDLPGTGGMLRKSVEDFRVDEIPLYHPGGEGEHLYLRVRKRGISTFEAIRRVATAIGVSEREIGYAGLKDARSVSTQWLSIRGADEERVRGIEVPRLEILQLSLHGNKLRIGHLRANRFAIVVREAARGADERAAAILDVLVSRGAPNYFGAQRFGSRGTTHLYGEAIVRRDPETFVKRILGGPPGKEKDPQMIAARQLFDDGRLQEAYEATPTRRRAEKKCLHALLRFGDPERAYFAIPRRLRQMYVSSFQSWLFNRILARRLPAIDRLLPGDIAYVHRTTRIFAVFDVAAEQPRCRAFEISPSGPLFGTRTPLAEGEVGARERELLAETGLKLEDFAVGGGMSFKGLRRSLRIPLREVVLTPLDDRSFRLEFEAPGGCFATSVLREIMKPGPVPD